MKISTISLFPEIFKSLDYGVTGRALAANIVQLTHHQMRDASSRKDRRVDDTPYGGSCGMLLSVDVLERAIENAISKQPGKIIQLCPTGEKFTQKQAAKLSLEPHIVFLCGRYEGMDKRIESRIDCSYSVGDYVLSGGELAAACMIDSIIRLLPGSLGNELSAPQDSFQENLLDFPQYTRPWDWRRQTPPDVLKSGNHQDIKLWQEQQMLGNTLLQRPDMLLGQKLTQQQVAMLKAFLKQEFEE